MGRRASIRPDLLMDKRPAYPCPHDPPLFLVVLRHTDICWKIPAAGTVRLDGVSFGDALGAAHVLCR